jgi:nitroreductase
VRVDERGTDGLEPIISLIMSRRTSMLVDRDTAVPNELVRRLCSAATWAPNHKRTWPWRFAVVEGDARAVLGERIADVMSAQDDPPDKVAKTRTKYLRTPTTVIVGSEAGDTPLRTAENRDATAAAVQNLLLAATAAGLASYWGSCPKGANDDVAEWCGFPANTHIVAIIYLGWAAGSVVAPDRPEPRISWLT